MMTKKEAYNAALKSDTAARKRLSALFDDGTYTEIGAFKKYGSDLSGVIAAYGYAEGRPVYAFSQDKTVKSGAVTKVNAEKIARTFALAAQNGVPVVGIYDSCGAYIEDGADALSAYSEILKAAGDVSGVVPVISVIAGVCSGSLSVIAESADVVVMSKDAELYMNAGETLRDAKTALSKGNAGIIADDDIKAVEEARKLIAYLPQNNLSAVPEFTYDEDSSDIADSDSEITLYDSYGSSAKTSLATVGGRTVGIVETSGKLTKADISKIVRVVRMCDAYSVPVVTVIDSEGFDFSEDSDIVRSASVLSGTYSEATTVKISVVKGKAYGAVFTALAGKNANADTVIAYEDAVISPADPLTAAEFLYHDELKGAEDTKAKREELAKRYVSEFCTSYDAAAKGAVDMVVSADKARSTVISALDISSDKRLLKTLPKKHSVMPF